MSASHPGSGKTTPPSTLGRIWRHRRLLTRLFVLLLVAVIVLQNSEPTRIDLLFWSLPSVPKLIFFLAGMVFGVGAWEVGRRTLRSR